MAEDQKPVPAQPGSGAPAGDPPESGRPGEAAPAAAALEQPRVWKCGRCRCDSVTKKVELDYMGYSISHELPVCPTCGKVYISKELAEGRMCEVEQTLEDK